MVTAPVLVHWLRNAPAQARAAWWVAEEAGDVVGWADAELDWTTAEPGQGRVSLFVAPHVRNRGIGSALYDEVVRHLRAVGATRIRVDAPDASGIAFAEQRGFVATRTERMSSVDPRTVDVSELAPLEEAAARDGYRVVPLRDLLDRLPELHAMYAEAHADMPSDVVHDRLAFEEWERETLRNPLLEPDGSMNVLHEERPVAFAWLAADRETGRAEHELTGTLRDYRGRKLARLAKLAAIRWCAANGIRLLLTGNDSANAPMLRINERLGYRPGRVWTELAKDL